MENNQLKVEEVDGFKKLNKGYQEKFIEIENGTYSEKINLYAVLFGVLWYFSVGCKKIAIEIIGIWVALTVIGVLLLNNMGIPNLIMMVLLFVVGKKADKIYYESFAHDREISITDIKTL